eukprot:gnl/MRDRNA2_/MRDRNA2_68410_c0_seq2.p1 gnl/MRDRNA2_/MRDRNA2_68410_c0~~gnl/MRDRNA2_/MRDRNA2_68410_c0_seq2.p1  ORF type:complete len:219 (-),score=39.90 gnl/MRDRNA2_/MRDRNA2_68410_c0_seq2:16-672(-)
MGALCSAGSVIDETETVWHAIIGINRDENLNIDSSHAYDPSFNGICINDGKNEHLHIDSSDRCDPSFNGVCITKGTAKNVGNSQAELDALCVEDDVSDDEETLAREGVGQESSSCHLNSCQQVALEDVSTSVGETAELTKASVTFEAPWKEFSARDELTPEATFVAFRKRQHYNGQCMTACTPVVEDFPDERCGSEQWECPSVSFVAKTALRIFREFS